MNNSNTPLITIIVAVFNGATTLQKCLNSIDAQTYRNRELIIIDGGSTDGTVEILKNNSQRINYWDSSPDRGIYHAFNKALAHTTGEWIYFIGADDVLHNEHVFEKFVFRISGIEQSPLVAYGKIVYCMGQKRKILGEEWKSIRGKIKSIMYVPHQGMFHSRKLFEMCGSFDEKYKIAGDYHLLLRSLRYSEPLFLDDIIVADQYAGGKSGDRASRWKVLQEFRSAQIDFGLALSARWVLEYTKALIWRAVYAVIRLKHAFL